MIGDFEKKIFAFVLKQICLQPYPPLIENRVLPLCRQHRSMDSFITIVFYQVRKVKENNSRPLRR